MIFYDFLCKDNDAYRISMIDVTKYEKWNDPANRLR